MSPSISQAKITRYARSSCFGVIDVDVRLPDSSEKAVQCIYSYVIPTTNSDHGSDGGCSDVDGNIVRERGPLNAVLQFS